MNNLEFNTIEHLPKTWSDAKRFGIKFYVSPKPCYKGKKHSRIRVTANRGCLDCFKERNKGADSINKITKWKNNQSYKEKMISTVKYRHKKKKYKEVFNLDVTKVVFPEICPVLGIKLNYFSNPDRNAEGIPNIDRIDNNIGYVMDNIQIISAKANRIKNNGTPEEIMKVAEYVNRK